MNNQNNHSTHEWIKLEQQLRKLAKQFSQKSGSDNDAFSLMKKILQDELGY